MEDLANEAMDFVKNNCVTWCDFQCSQRKCEKLNNNKMEITQEEYSELKTKANKWDTLDNKLAEIYGEGDDDNEQETDLVDIGEICATAFGYL